MEDPEINEVALEETIAAATRGDEEALRLLIFCKWLRQLLARISRSAAFQFDLDAETIRDFVEDQLRKEIVTIENHRHVSWRACLAAWCYQVAHHFCLNSVRHRGVEEKYCDIIAHDNTQIIRNGERIVDQYSHTPSPEDELDQKEQDELWGDRQSRMRACVLRVFHSFQPEEFKVAILWAQNMTLAEIAAETDTSTATAGRRLKKVQRAIFEGMQEVITQEITPAPDPEGEEAAPLINLKGQPELVAGLRELIANSLQGLANFDSASLNTA